MMMMILIPMSYIMIEAEDNPEKIEQISENLALDPGLNVMSIVVTIGSIGILIWTIYLITTWSEQWNKQFF